MKWIYEKDIKNKIDPNAYTYYEFIREPYSDSCERYLYVTADWIETDQEYSRRSFKVWHDWYRGSDFQKELDRKDRIAELKKELAELERK